METVDFLETANWILEQLTALDVDKFLQVLQSMAHGAGAPPDQMAVIMKTSHQLPLLRERFLARPNAPAIFKTQFPLSFLIHQKFDFRRSG